MDAVFGLALVGLLTGVLTFAIAQQRRGSKRAAEQRALLHRVESALTDLQRGAPWQAPEKGDIDLRVDALTESKAPAKQTWVRVTAREGERSAALAGLVPTAALPADTADAPANGGTRP